MTVYVQLMRYSILLNVKLFLICDNKLLHNVCLVVFLIINIKYLEHEVFDPHPVILFIHVTGILNIYFFVFLQHLK